MVEQASLKLDFGPVICVAACLEKDCGTWSGSYITAMREPPARLVDDRQFRNASSMITRVKQGLFRSFIGNPARISAHLTVLILVLTGPKAGKSRRSNVTLGLWMSPWIWVVRVPQRILGLLAGDANL